MKRHIFAILLSLAVMLAFMPAGAYAADSQASAAPIVIAKAVPKGNSAIKISWNETKGATKYVVYGNRCGKEVKIIKTVKGTSLTVKKAAGKKIKAHNYYRFQVKAYKGSKCIANSKALHVISANTKGKYGNVTKVTAKKKSISLKVGKTATVGATKKIYGGKKHIKSTHGDATRYISTNSKVASVSKSGKVTARKAGKAHIYIQDIGGAYAVTTVTVTNPKKSASNTPAAVKYAVSFDANGGTGSMPGQSFTKGVKQALAANAFKKDDYEFAGWNTKSDGSGSAYTDGQSISITADVILYAQWKKKALRAFYDTSNGKNTLSFYYDTKKHAGKDMGALPVNAASDMDWPYNSFREDIKSVVIDSSVAGYTELKSTGYMFFNMINAANISGAEYLVMDQVESMNSMFASFGYDVKTLNVVPDVSGWETGCVKSVNNMFYYYGRLSSALKAVPETKNWDTSNIEVFQGMFRNYGEFSDALDAVPDVSGWNTVRATDMSRMFECYGKSSAELSKVPDVSEWETGTVKNISYMFDMYGYGSPKLAAVPNITRWDTSNVENVSTLFSYYGYKSTGKLVFGFGNWNVGKITKANAMLEKIGGNSATVEIYIPEYTGSTKNLESKWFIGDGSNKNEYIVPPSGKSFIIPIIVS